MNPRLKRRIRFRLALAAAVMIPALAAAPALAHDALQSTSPAQDTTVTTAPDTVSLTLSEPPTDSESLNLSIITVTDGTGETLSDGKVTVTGPTISTKIAQGSNGPYKVLWRAVSSDGHPIEGSYSFTVQDPARAAATVSPSATASTTPSTAASPPATTVPGQVKPPNDDNGPLTAGIAAAILAAVIGVLYLARRRRAKNAAL